MKYQVTESLPYFTKRWIFLRKSAKLEPLYTFDIPEVVGFHEIKQKGIA
jgi:hypothetical protein